MRLCVFVAGMSGLTNSGNRIPETQSQVAYAFTLLTCPWREQPVFSAGWTLACAVTFLYRVRPLKFARVIKMLEASLSQLEQLVGDLVQQNQNLQNTNAQLSAELAKAKDENDSLQLSLMEQEEKQGSTAARIQALVERATSASAVGA